MEKKLRYNRRSDEKFQKVGAGSELGKNSKYCYERSKEYGAWNKTLHKEAQDNLVRG